MLWIKSLPTRCCAFISVLAMFFACTPEENNASGTDEPGGRHETIHVTGISLNPTAITIQEGESATIAATVSPDNADNKAYSWSSSNDQVASVSDGKVVGIKAGSTTIIVSTEDGGKTATCSVTVEQNLAPSVTVGADHISAISALLQGKANLGNSTSSDLKVGFQYSKSAGILPSNSTTIEATDADANYNYTASITALEPATKYYFRSFVRQNGQDTYGETKEFTTKELASLIETKDASGVEATKASLNAKLDLADVKYSSISYGFYWGASESSQNNGLSGGEIKDNAYSAPLTGLSHKTQYWYKAYVKLDEQTFYGEVKTFTTAQWVTGISLDKTSITLNEGQEQTLIPTVNPSNAADKSLNWTSSNTSVATVNAEGKVTAVSKGTATIKAEAKDGSGKYASCSVTVNRIVSSIQLNKTSIAIFNGKTEALIATVIPSDASNTAVTWTSSNTSVATVSSSGVMTGKSRGTATITVTANDGNGAQASCEVEVRQYVTSISLDNAFLLLMIGAEATLSVTNVQPDNANDKSYTWSSSDSSIASVDNSGKVTARANGNATIKATANDGSGVFASCSVIVFAEKVDMGIKTSDGKTLYWSTRNLCESGFVNSPEEYGDYYAWGETEPKENYSWSTYKFGTSSSGPFSKYNTNSSYGTVDNKTVLEPEDDVAHVKLGGKWRMPTYAEWTELRTKCTWTWTTNYNGTGVKGRIVTAPNGNSIFLPAAGHRFDTHLSDVGSDGYYWSSSLYTNSLYTDSPSYAWYVNVGSVYVVGSNGFSRFCGKSVRPVSE